MVQFKPTLEKLKEEQAHGDHSYRNNTYWMLGFYIKKNARQITEYLQERGYTCRAKASKSTAMHALGRYQCGLLSYDKFNLTELREFCKARGLPNKATTVSRLARILEKADDVATFPKFLELPAELRNKIYELHFSDYDAISTKHCQPPLTLVPQIRAEALPLFYHCVTFVWSFESEQGIDDCRYSTGASADTCHLSAMPATSLSRIANLKVEWARISWYGWSNWYRTVWMTVRLVQSSTTGNSVDITRERTGTLMEHELDQTIDDVLRSTLQGHRYWDNDFKMQSAHIWSLRAAVCKLLFNEHGILRCRGSL